MKTCFRQTNIDNYRVAAIYILKQQYFKVSLIGIDLSNFNILEMEAPRAKKIFFSDSHFISSEAIL